ncbi:IS3 family transposase [Bacillus sp. JCM 19034]|uniref:IS3 family transposase n=1 Tax=Bacillus sp. JCM 19034 TaxID=1481928 RepID=UPI000AA54532
MQNNLHTFLTCPSKAIDAYISFYNYERYQQRLNGLSLLNIELKPLKSFSEYPLSI